MMRSRLDKLITKNILLQVSESGTCQCFNREKENDKEKIIIQGGIGCHPPLPIGSHTIFHLNRFFLAFRVLKFWCCFEALNNIFWARRSHVVD
jgi:hypothetical protein